MVQGSDISLFAARSRDYPLLPQFSLAIPAAFCFRVWITISAKQKPPQNLPRRLVISRKRLKAVVVAKAAAVIVIAEAPVLGATIAPVAATAHTRAMYPAIAIQTRTP